MPCESGPSQRDLELEQQDRDITARLACLWCRRLERLNKPIPPWARRWWREHKQFDAERRKEEAQQRKQQAVKARALKKARSALSKAERAALGLR